MFNPAYSVGNLVPKAAGTDANATTGMNVPFAVEPIHTPPAHGRRASADFNPARSRPGPARFQKGPSPINLRVLIDFISSYPAREDAAVLVEGFKSGFIIPFKGRERRFFLEIRVQFFGMEAVVREKINKELQVGRVIGPFPSLLHPA